MALTKEGEKYVVENPTTKDSGLADDLKANEDYEEAQPDYLSATDDAFNKKSSKPAQPAEAAPVAAEEIAVDVVADTTVTDSAVAEVEEEVIEVAADPNAAYNRLCARVNVESHNMLLGHYEVVKCRDVLCTQDMLKEGRGECVVIYTFTDKTPFGYVLGAPAEGYLQTSDVKFRLYQDLGWKVI